MGDSSCFDRCRCHKRKQPRSNTDATSIGGMSDRQDQVRFRLALTWRSPSLGCGLRAGQRNEKQRDGSSHECSSKPVHLLVLLLVWNVFRDEKEADDQWEQCDGRWAEEGRSPLVPVMVSGRRYTVHAYLVFSKSPLISSPLPAALFVS